MKLFLIRHGEPDWNLVEERGVRGMATSSAPLTPVGRLQIDTIARDFRLEEAEAILCSSYARALESAARLSRVLNKPMHVEYDLHEWLPQKDSLADIDRDLLLRAREGLERLEQESPSHDDVPWESLQEVRERVVRVLRRYHDLKSVIVVSHAVVMSSLIGSTRKISHAEIVPLELDLHAPLPRLQPQPRV